MPSVERLGNKRKLVKSAYPIPFTLEDATVVRRGVYVQHLRMKSLGLATILLNQHGLEVLKWHG